MGPVPATGKKIGFFAAHSIELNDAGKVVKETLSYDGGTVAGQLGLMPMPHRKAVDTGWTDKPIVVASGSEIEKSNLAAMAKEIEAFNKRDGAGALATAADDVVFSEMSAPADRVGKKEALKGMEDMYKAFPDAKLNVKSSWAAGDYVVTTGTWSGTNTGDSPAMKMKKTGKAVAVQFVEIDKFAAGKTKNIWLFSNGAAAAAQLGLLPPKAAEPKAKPAATSKPEVPKPAATSKPEAAAKPAAAKPETAAKPAATKPETAAKPSAESKPAAPKSAVATPAPKPAAPVK